MKHLFFLLLTYSISTHGYSQQVVVANSKENVIYSGLSNPLTVAVDGCKCKDFKITTNNGTVESTDESCSYTIRPSNAGIAIISVIKKRSNSIIGTVKIKVKNIPPPVAMVANKTGGEISKNNLKYQVGISGDILNQDIDAHILITQFTVIILRDGKCVFVKKYEGQLFTPELKNEFALLEINDEIIFSNILYKGSANSGTLQPIEFKIIE